LHIDNGIASNLSIFYGCVNAVLREYFFPWVETFHLADNLPFLSSEKPNLAGNMQIPIFAAQSRTRSLTG
jgi:hypothetical protein